MSSSQPRVAIITGASRGIGAVIAKQLAGEGFAVVINYASSAGEATQLVAQLREDGHEAIAVQADVSSADDVKRLFDEAEAQLGKVDVLINNCGWQACVGAGLLAIQAMRFACLTAAKPSQASLLPQAMCTP